jgi:uncharacterized RDD family membrane protein YckC
MRSGGKGSFFNPHETARAESLAGAPLASFHQRLFAILIDFFLVFATYLPAAALLQYLIQERLHIHEDFYRSAHIRESFDLQALLEVAWTLWLVLYFGLFVWKTNGFTPGKRLLRIRILSLTHQRISFWQSIERALGYGASALEAGLGFLQYFLYPNHCCVHDRIAETIVVKDPRTGTKPAEAA